MTQLLERVSAALVSGILAHTARTLVVAGIALLGIGAFRPRATSVRLFIWTSVLYASLALPLLGWLLPPVRVAGLNSVQHQAAQALQSHSKESAPSKVSVQVPATRSEHEAATTFAQSVSLKQPIEHRTQAGVSRPSILSREISWQIIAAGIYLAVMLGFLGRLIAGMALSRKLACEAEELPELVVDMTGRSAGYRVVMSENISVPVTIGVFRPTILLPPDWQQWDAAKLNSVLAHELSHVKRRDPLTQYMALLYRGIFWLNPLAWWLHRHLAALAEQASDEAALSCGADRNHYARTLLSFFTALQGNPGRIRWQGVSMARRGQAEKRLERILAWKGTVAMSFKRSLAIAIIVIAVPVVFLAATVHPANSQSALKHMALQASTAPAAAKAPVTGVVGIPPVAGVPAPGAVPALAPAAGVPPASTIPAVAPLAAMSLKGPGHVRGVIAPTAPGSDDSKRFFYAYGDDEGERFVIASGKTDSFTMSGSGQDARHVERLKKQISGDFIWFQRDEKSYIIRDQATIDRARALWAPQEELGKKQEALGKQQEELGRQQEELGKKMEQVKVNVPDMISTLDRLKAKLQKLGPTASADQLGELQSEIGELQSKIGEIQSEAGEQQGKFGELQGELGEKQGKLGEQQGELGRQQGELAEKATKEMKGLLDEAIKNGTAKPEEEVVKGLSSSL
jgi:beta-lactamase regulating signal transducer with metallopeptidase domain